MNNGHDAIQNVLVDELVGLTAAITKARSLAEIEEDVAVRITTYPQVTPGLGLFGVQSGASASEL